MEMSALPPPSSPSTATATVTAWLVYTVTGRHQRASSVQAYFACAVMQRSCLPACLTACVQSYISPDSFVFSSCSAPALHCLARVMLACCYHRGSRYVTRFCRARRPPPIVLLFTRKFHSLLCPTGEVLAIENVSARITCG